MAINDPIFLDGGATLYKSSGTTVDFLWMDGQAIVIHEYVAVTPTNLKMAKSMFNSSIFSSKILGGN
jgi:hypothetical protein